MKPRPFRLARDGRRLLPCPGSLRVPACRGANPGLGVRRQGTVRRVGRPPCGVDEDAEQPIERRRGRSVRSGWHWTPNRNRPSAASRPSTRSPAGLLAHALATRPARDPMPARLVVVRVDLQDAAARVGREQDPGQPRAGRDPERMGLRRALAPARSLVAVDVLDERPAREGVDRLEPATQPEHRQAARLGRLPRLPLERIAVRLHRGRAPAGLSVALRVEVRSAADEQAVHRRERGRPVGRAGRRVEDDRRRAVARHGRRVEVVLAGGEVGLRLASRDGDGHDDPGSGRVGWLHRVRVVEAQRSGVGAGSGSPPGQSTLVGRSDGVDGLVGAVSPGTTSSP